MQIIADLLDKQLIDQSGFRMGKIDGVILDYSKGSPPVIRALEVGPITAATRLNRKLGERFARFVRKYSESYGAVRIPISQVLEIGVNVKVGMSAPESPILAFERWLSRAVVSRIPGG